MTYAEKLQDPRWQKKRLEILQRDKFTCQLCDDDKTTLHIHHKKYKGDPWDIENEHLITYCKHCHEIIESYKAYKIFVLLKVIKLVPIDDTVPIVVYVFFKNKSGNQIDIFHIVKDLVTYKATVMSYIFKDIEKIFFNSETLNNG